MRRRRPNLLSDADASKWRLVAGGDGLPSRAFLWVGMKTPMIYINGRFAAQNLSGVQRFATETTLALQRILGDRVQLVVPPDAKIAVDGAKIVGRRTGQAWEQWELPRAAKDGVLINLGNTGPILARRQVVVIHDAGVFSTPEAYSWKFRLWYKILHQLLIRVGARIVTVSAFSRQDIARHLPVAAAAIAVVPEGADHMEGLGADLKVLAAHGLQPGKYVFAVGTLAAHKNLGALSDLADRLVERGMVLAVTGAFGAAVFRGDGARKLPASARYIGRVSDEALKALYGNAACYVLPSTYEGFGLPAVEAMHCGCAVAAADIPALRETCGNAAVFFNPAAPADIADTVLALIDDAERLAALRAASPLHVRDMTWAKTALALKMIIDAAQQPVPTFGVDGAEPPQGTNAMNIAVVVASVNRPEEIGQLLLALKNQSLPPSAIVLSVAAASDLPADLPPGVEVVMGTPGLAAQRNRGMETVLGRSDAVVFFDDDFIPTRESISGVSRFFDACPDVVGGTGLVLHDGVKEGGISYLAALEIVRDFESKPELPLVNEDFLFAYGCNMAFRTSAIGQLRFDENLPLYGWQEDMDYAAQIAVYGKVIRTTAFAGVHRGVNKGRTPGLQMGFSQIVNPAYLVRKGTMRPKKAATLMFRNMVANHVKIFWPEPHIDRPGRLAGNWLGLFHLLRGNPDPNAVFSFRK